MHFIEKTMHFISQSVFCFLTVVIPPFKDLKKLLPDRIIKKKLPSLKRTKTRGTTLISAQRADTQ
jgi:hypothetical protein